MTTTNPTLLNTGYSSLTQSKTAATATPAITAAPETTAASVGNASLAYLLNLSPEAQNYLSSGLTSGSGINTGTSSYSASSSFTLNRSQQKQLDAILQKYKGQPYTQDTFNQIEADLEKSGLSSEQLATQSKINAFNPTYSLLDALSGNDSNGLSASLVPSDNQLETQKSNYTKMIGAAFQKLAAPDTTDTVTGGVDASA